MYVLAVKMMNWFDDWFGRAELTELMDLAIWLTNQSNRFINKYHQL